MLALSRVVVFCLLSVILLVEQLALISLRLLSLVINYYTRLSIEIYI